MRNMRSSGPCLKAITQNQIWNYCKFRYKRDNQTNNSKTNRHCHGKDLKKGMNTNNSKTQNRTVLEATQSKPHKNQGFSRCYGTISSSRITCQYKSGNRSFFSSRSYWKTRTGLCSRHYNRRQLLNRYCITFNQSVLVLIFEGRTNFPTFFFSIDAL